MADQRRNIKNNESQLFRSLTKLFSGPLVNFRQQAEIKYKRRHLNKFDFKSASGKQFQKTSYNPFDSLQANLMANQTRAERYADFDQMEFQPDISSAIDIYADEMTTHSSLRKMLNIKSTNQEIRSILETLYYDVLNVEFNLFGWCRTMVKYGDMFLYLDLDEESGVKGAIGLPSPEIERLEGEDKTNPNYVQFQWNSGGLTFENWQIAHFRILGQDKYAPYGTSVLEPARRIWRQLTLLEDAMMAYRIVRAPDRRVFYIDVGNIAPEDVEQFMLRIKDQMKRNMIVDPITGRVDLRYNPMSIDEDYFIPTRGQSNTRIDTLAGGAFQGDIDDVKYLRDKLFAALKVPQSYLSREEGAGEDKATLAQKDIRFARTIQRLQRVVVSELEKIGVIHLYTLGYRNEDLLNFSLSLNNPSKISELQELEHWKTKFEVASQAKEGFFSKRWIAENIFNLSENEFKRIQREIFYDKQYDTALEGIATAGEPAAGEEGGGGGLADLGDLGGGEEAAGGDEEESAEVTEPTLPGGAAPAKRRDNGYVSVGKRGVGDGRGKSGHIRTEKSIANPGSVNLSDSRSYLQGVSDLNGLVKDSISTGLNENVEPTYKDENERAVLEMNRDIQSLLIGLERKNGKDQAKA
jgi:hypothetical protein